jgi:trk system potassium uptake protein TrkA
VRIIVAGAGRLGQELARILTGTGHEVTIVERDDDLVERLLGRTKARVILGDACEPSVLEEAGALTAEVLTAMTGDDEDNLVISLLAKRQFDVPRVVARVNHPKNGWLFTDKWGVDVGISGSATLTSLFQEATRSSDTVSLARLGGGAVGLIETTLATASLAVGKPMRSIVLPGGSTVAAVLRGGVPRSPHPDLELEVGDEVLVLSSEASEADVRALFQ